MIDMQIKQTVKVDIDLINYLREQNKSKEEIQHKIQNMVQLIKEKEEQINHYNTTLIKTLKIFQKVYIYLSNVKKELKEEQTQQFNIVCFMKNEQSYYCLDTNTNILVIPQTEAYYDKILSSKMESFKKLTLVASKRKQLIYKDKSEDYFSIYVANHQDLKEFKTSFTLEFKKNSPKEQYPFKNNVKQLLYVKQESIIKNIKEYNDKQLMIKVLNEQLITNYNQNIIESNAKNAKKLEQLEENKQYIIQAIKQYHYQRGKVDKQRYYLLIDNQVYNSNFFFESQMQNKYKDQTIEDCSYNTALQTLICKTTPSKNKELNNIIHF
ncbi:hypothetical protein ABPG72_011667 [Tetrahymena utriculariae]